MKNPISDFTDELEDAGKEIAKDFASGVREMGQIAKDQVMGNGENKKSETSKNKVASKASQTDNNNKLNQKVSSSEQNVDPVTGLPPIKKKATLTNLTAATAQLQMAKLKKLREELEQQRLKVSDKKAELAPIESSKTQGKGPSMADNSEREPKDEAVANTLKGSKDTGEFKGLVGG